MTRLTRRELEILALSRYSRTEISEILGISISTINVHRMHIFQKLNAYNLIDAVIIALSKGIIRLDDFNNAKQYIKDMVAKLGG